jgi:hypothetical protein
MIAMSEDDLIGKGVSAQGARTKVSYSLAWLTLVFEGVL